MRRAGPALAPPQGRAGPVLAHQPHLPRGRQGRPGRRTKQMAGGLKLREAFIPSLGCCLGVSSQTIVC